MKNILILSTDKFYHGIGGLCTQLRETINGFEKLQIPYYFWIVSPDLITYSGSNYTVIPINVLSYDMITPFNEYLSVINNSGLYVAASMNFIQKNGKPDLIHAFDWGTFTAAQILSHYIQVPYIASVALSIQKEVASYRNYSPTLLDIDSNYMQVFQVCCMIEAFGMQNAEKILFNTKLYAKSIVSHFYK